MNDSFVQDLLTENKNLKETIFSLTQSNALLVDTNFKLVSQMDSFKKHEEELNFIKVGLQTIVADIGKTKDIVTFIKALYTTPKAKKQSTGKKPSQDERVANIQMKLISPKKLF